MSSCSLQYNEVNYSDFVKNVVNSVKITILLSISRLSHMSDNDIFVFLTITDYNYFATVLLMILDPVE